MHDDNRDDVAPDALDRLIDAALREDPGYTLPSDFSARVARRALPPRSFDWPAHVLFPSALLLTTVYGAIVLPGRLGPALSRLGATLDQFGGIVPDFALRPLPYAVLAVALTAIVDRWVSARINTTRARS